VVSAGADMGVAYDGDADRCLAIDHEGATVNGDHILGLLATAMRDSGTLYRDTMVATVMSNLGLHHAMRDADIDIVETAVGDRYVLEAMREGGYSLGGEQSGHVIVSRYATTGDGILTSLMLASLVARHGSLAELARRVNTLPQVLINVGGVDRSRVHTDVELGEALEAARTELGDSGRVLLRASGTEPLVRVMVEASTPEDAQRHADRLAAVVAVRLSL
jgi:phosphoglucosamine mutase